MMEFEYMVSLISESPNGILKDVLNQYWQVGPLGLTLEINNNPKFNHFGDDVEECWISYCSYREPSSRYDGEDTGYKHLITVCDAHAIPYVIADNGVGQMLFYIPSAHKMVFLEGLEAHVAAYG
jgi:hypothetical protein